MKKFVFVLALSLSSLMAMASDFASDLAPDFAFREGDIVFRSGRNYPVMYISGSTITHCGIIVDTPSGLQVLEAAGRVRLTPIEDFFGKRIGKAERLTRRVSDRERKVDYKRFLNKRYDNAFSLDNDAYYCSELVYLIYKDQFHRKLCDPRPLRDYHVFGLRWLIRKRGIDLDQPVVTPADLYRALGGAERNPWLGGSAHPVSGPTDYQHLTIGRVLTPPVSRGAQHAPSPVPSTPRANPLRFKVGSARATFRTTDYQHLTNHRVLTPPPANLGLTQGRTTKGGLSAYISKTRSSLMISTRLMGGRITEFKTVPSVFAWMIPRAAPTTMVPI